MLPLFLCLIVLPYVYGGSKCPPRSEIYPCICLDRSIGKSRFHTTVICHALEDGQSLMSIEAALQNLEINKFLLYDSYWSNNLRSLQAESRVPVNILSSFKMEEVEVVDSAMHSLACPQEYNCGTNYLKRFTAINATVPNRGICNNIGFTVNSWISCPNNIETLTIERGFSDERSLKPEFFPEPMTKLKVLRLPNNGIVRVDKRTFSPEKFPALETLDLSHNYLTDVKNLFLKAMPNLKNLDLSFNSIRHVVDFQYLPNLFRLDLMNNSITYMLQNDWNRVPTAFRHLDLTNNKLECGCGINFINSTFHIHAVLVGNCSAPEQTKDKTLRKAWRYLIERCNDKGEIGTRIRVKAPLNTTNN